MFSWSSFLSYVIASAITPGSNNIVSLSNGLRVGVRKGISYNIGLLFGQLLIVPGVILLCRAFSSVLDSLLPVIKFIGAAYLMYLAWKTLRSSTELQAGESKTGFLRGVVMQFVNPKLYLYVLIPAETMILPVFGDRPAILLLFGAGMAVNSMVCSACWLCFGGALCRVYQRYGRFINIAVALALVYCAVSLFR